MAAKESASVSVVWSAIERFSVQGISFVLSLIIARLVMPSEFGLIAMLNIFISLAQAFVDSGFSNALIQKQDRTEIDYSTVFHFNIVVSLFFYLLLFAAAPLIADFYEQPRLVSVTRWIALSFVLSSFSVVQRAKLTITHDFKTQAIASLISVIISGVLGVIFAYLDYGVWALVIQTNVNQLLISLFLWIFAKWSPKLVFSWQSFKTLFSFGSKLLVSGLINSLYTNMYTIVIGKTYNSTQLGYYSKANMLSQFSAVSLSTILHRAVYPFECELQKQDDRLRSFFISYLRLCAYVSFPILALIFILAHPFVSVILTDKWLPAVPMIQILALAYMWYTLSYVNCQLLNVKGRSDLFLKAEIIKKIIAVVLLIVAMPLGINALCWSLVIYQVVDYLIIIPFVNKVIGINFSDEIKGIMPSLLLTIVSSGITFFLIKTISNEIVQLFVGVAGFSLVFIAASILLRFKEVHLLKQQLQRLGLFK